MCCVLFICLDTAISHLHSGIEIMAAWRARNRKHLLDKTLSISPEPKLIPDNLIQMFSRLTIQSMLCGRDPRNGRPVVSGVDLLALTPDEFPSIQAARVSLDYSMKISLQFLRELHEPHFQIRPEAKCRLDDLTRALDKWSLAFDLFLVDSLATRTRQEIRAATNLRILNIVAKVWLSGLVSAEEIHLR
jgi:hypothetical protein